LCHPKGEKRNRKRRSPKSLERVDKKGKKPTGRQRMEAPQSCRVKHFFKGGGRRWGTSRSDADGVKVLLVYKDGGLSEDVSLLKENSQIAETDRVSWGDRGCPDRSWTDHPTRSKNENLRKDVHAVGLKIHGEETAMLVLTDRIPRLQHTPTPTLRCREQKEHSFGECRVRHARKLWFTLM